MNPGKSETGFDVSKCQKNGGLRVAGSQIVNQLVEFVFCSTNIYLSFVYGWGVVIYDYVVW